MFWRSERFCSGVEWGQLQGGTGSRNRATYLARKGALGPPKSTLTRMWFPGLVRSLVQILPDPNDGRPVLPLNPSG